MKNTTKVPHVSVPKGQKVATLTGKALHAKRAPKVGNHAAGSIGVHGGRSRVVPDTSPGNPESYLPAQKFSSGGKVLSCK